MPIANQHDPQLRCRHMRIRLCDLIGHLRADIRDLDEPRLAAIFATAAEVLGGVVTALDRYAPEPAAQPAQPPVRLRRSG